MKVKNIKKLKVAADILTVTNIAASTLCFIMAYGAVGTMDYNTEVGLTGEETALTIKMFTFCALWGITLFAARKFGQFSEFLSNCIDLHNTRARRKQIQICINTNREALYRAMK